MKTPLYYLYLEKLLVATDLISLVPQNHWFQLPRFCKEVILVRQQMIMKWISKEIGSIKTHMDTQTLIVALFLTPSFPLYLSFSVSLALSISLSFYLSLHLSLSVSLSLSIYLYLSLFLHLSLFLILSLSLSLSHTHTHIFFFFPSLSRTHTHTQFLHLSFEGCQGNFRDSEKLEIEARHSHNDNHTIKCKAAEQYHRCERCTYDLYGLIF